MYLNLWKETYEWERGTFLAKHVRKRERWTRRDRRKDFPQAEERIFLSRESQLQSRQARMLKLEMRIVLGLVIAAVAAAAVLFIVFYMVPFFHAEIKMESSEVESVSSQEPIEVPTYDSMGLPVYSDEITLFVINRDYPADASYVPDTVEAEGVPVETHAVDALEMMVEAAKEDGLALTFTEGYISYEEQEQRFEAKTQELMEGPDGLTTVMARTEARFQVPMAGECDQQTGLCLRLDANPDTFAESKTYSWLQNNMGKYGFIFRYPEDKEDFTGCYGDYTVIRYVGSDNAVAMTQRSMCLEEYISYLASQ